jgi:hypothetical protein
MCSLPDQPFLYGTPLGERDRITGVSEKQKSSCRIPAIYSFNPSHFGHLAYECLLDAGPQCHNGHAAMLTGAGPFDSNDVVFCDFHQLHIAAVHSEVRAHIVQCVVNALKEFGLIDCSCHRIEWYGDKDNINTLIIILVRSPLG